MKFDRIIEQSGEINLNWLFLGEGPVRKRESGKEGRGARPPAAEPEVPYYRSVLPGSGTGISPEVGGNMIPFALPSTFITEELEASPDELFLMRADGDGMEPTIRNREFMLVRKGVRRPYAGKIYLIRMNESLLCKRIHEEPGNRLRLISDNSRYEDLHIRDGSGEVDIVGRVVWHGRTL